MIHADDAMLLLKVTHRKSVRMATLAHLYHSLDKSAMGWCFYGSTFLLDAWAESHFIFLAVGEPSWKRDKFHYRNSFLHALFPLERAMIQPGPMTDHGLRSVRFQDDENSSFIFRLWFFSSLVRVAKDNLLPLMLIGGTVMVTYNPHRCHRQMGLSAGGFGLLSYHRPMCSLGIENMRMIDEARNIKG